MKTLLFLSVGIPNTLAPCQRSITNPKTRKPLDQKASGRKDQKPKGQKTMGTRRLEKAQIQKSRARKREGSGDIFEKIEDANSEVDVGIIVRLYYRNHLSNRRIYD